MTYNGLFNIKESMRKWRQFPDMYFSQETFDYYNNKIITDHVDLKDPENMFNGDEEIIDTTYVKYVMLLHMKNVTDYIVSKGVFLGNVEQNIKTILNEIINDEVNESYYDNTLEIYRDISDLRLDEEIYILLNQAIKRDNLRMIYYLIYYRQNELTCWYEDSVLHDLLGFFNNVNDTPMSIW